MSGSALRSPRTRLPLHLHVQAAALELVEHLGEPLLLRLVALGSCDPAQIIVALIRGPLPIRSEQPAFVQGAADERRHALGRAAKGSRLLLLLGSHRSPRAALVTFAGPRRSRCGCR